MIFVPLLHYFKCKNTYSGNEYGLRYRLTPGKRSVPDPEGGEGAVKEESILMHANCLALVPSISDIRPNSKPFLKSHGIIFSRRPAAKLPQNFLPSRACAGGEDGV